MSLDIQVRRPDLPGIVGVEVWDMPVAGCRFVDLVGASTARSLARDGATPDDVARRVASGISAALPGLQARTALEALHLAGGLSELPRLAEHVQAIVDVPVTADAAGRFSGEAGGYALLSNMGAPHGVVIDAGQTAAKISVPTDHRTLRERGDARRIGDVVAPALVEALRDRNVDPAVVLALPCEVSESCDLGPCTYDGCVGKGAIIELLVAAIDRLAPAHSLRHASSISVLLLNDAMLSALSASPNLHRGRTLVLTLGHGPGAAVVRR